MLSREVDRSRKAQRLMLLAQQKELAKAKRREQAQRNQAHKSAVALQQHRDVDRSGRADAEQLLMQDSPARSLERTVGFFGAVRTATNRAAAAATAESELAALNLMTPPELASAVKSVDFPAAVDCNLIHDISAVAGSALNELDVVCAVCDCWTPPDDQSCQKWLFSAFAQEMIQHKLSADGVLPPLAPEIKEHYDLSGLDDCLAGLLLSTHMGAQVSPTPPLVCNQLFVCSECALSLLGDSPAPPTNAIANNNAIGILPSQLRDSSWAERSMVSLAYGRAWIVVLKGGAQKALRGHTLTVEMDPGVVAEKLPRSPADCTFKVVIAGALTPVQKLASLRTHQVRRQQLEDQLAFYMEHNPLYRHVTLNKEELAKCKEEDSFIRLQGLSVAVDGVPSDTSEPMGNENLARSVLNVVVDARPPVEESSAAAAAAASSTNAPLFRARESQRPRRPPLRFREEALEDEEFKPHEEIYTVRHVSSVSASAVGPDDDALLDARPQQSSSLGGTGIAAMATVTAQPTDSFQVAARTVESQFVTAQGVILAVRTGSKFVAEHLTDILCLMFPDCFPFARGGFNETRRKKMARSTQVARLLRLSWGTFGHTSFVLKVYNMLARAEAAQKAYIRVQLGDMSFKGLTTAEVSELITYQTACSVATRSHSALPAPPAGLSATAKALFSTMEVCAGTMQHTDQFAKKFGRVRVFAMWNQYSTPTLMCTLNPNDLASLNLLHWAGIKVAPGDVPDPAVRRAAVADSPAAAALNFHRAVSIFIKYVVGWDLKRHTASKKGGFFGVPIAVFAAVEEQNRGSLHLHLLVWISGALPLALQNQAMLPVEFESLRQRMGAYIESIMSTEVQCPSQYHVSPLQLGMASRVIPPSAFASWNHCSSKRI